MCGIAGFLQGDRAVAEPKTVLRRMADQLEHRGPDDQGVWFDPESGVGLAHRRLSILDLSRSGAQPMASSDGRFVIVYNGEIYNFPELRVELEKRGVSFRGGSDTEVILEAIAEWGIISAVQRFIGMFAFAVWDRSDRTLWLFRDRMGIKPLYYGVVGDTVVFGSELKALTQFPGYRRRIDRGALALFARHGYVPAPHSIYRGVKKLLPGRFLRLSAGEGAEGEPDEFWSVRDRIQSQNGSRHFEAEAELAAFDELLNDAIGLRMISDVPLGAFLSGGIDSSLIVAMMQRQADKPVKTFTIGFEEDEYNEAGWASDVAQYLGTDHTELVVSPEQALSVIPELPTIFDEPFADSSQVPTILVSRLARNDVTVALSGDGGDELFFGYNSYFTALAIWSKLHRIPLPIRKSAAAAIGAVPDSTLDRFFRRAVGSLDKFGAQGSPSDKLRKLASLLSAIQPNHFYRELVSHWKRPDDLVLGATESDSLLGSPPEWMTDLPLSEYMMLADAQTYLPDDILTKVDRASMSTSLEARVPLLDHRVVEFAWSLPMASKFRNGQGKWLLRQTLKRYIPEELFDRPKMGFGVPIDSWLRGPLRDWAEGLLVDSRLREEGFFNPMPVRQRWQEHLSGSRNWQAYLWDVLMFQAWLEREKAQNG